MSAQQVCQNYLLKSSTIHRHRANILFKASWSLTQGADLTLTSMGRKLDGHAQVKNKIKAIDRLLGNRTLAAETHQVYKEFITPILEVLSTVFIIVDWSGCCSSEFHMLRAVLQYDGRGVPLYNEIHPGTVVGNVHVHRRFLNNLKAIIPKKCHVVIVTDGGFATPWFDAVTRLGWDFVGRINRKMQIQFDENDEDSWVGTLEIGSDATQRPKFYGTGKMGKKSATPVEGHIYVYKKPGQNRKDKSPFPDTNKQYTQMNKSPWVIATSLCPKQYKARQIMNIYKKRMQVEQNFRDDKSYRFGLGWRFSGTRTLLRLQILILIASIAIFFLWWIGLTAELHKFQYRFQANSIKHRRVLSLIYLGKEICTSDYIFDTSQTFYETAIYFANSYLRTILWVQ